jgi:phosphatidylserine/phosphatidylglycerophosphate/cardiolipin synthase-like enzyme
VTIDLGLSLDSPGDTIAARFLRQGDQSAGDIAVAMTRFIDGSRSSLHLAVYDCRLDGPTAAILRSALDAARNRGVDVRLVYDESFKKPQSGAAFNEIGGDFAEPETHERVAELGLPGEQIRAIHGDGLMHQKFMIRDQTDVFAGSMNWTNDSMTRMENTLIALQSAMLGDYFERDFGQLWKTGVTTNSGNFRTSPDTLAYGGTSASTDVDFSPGQGEYINDMVARRILRAHRQIIFCSMLINSSKVLNALMTVLDQQKIELWGVYDRTQMAGVLEQWRGQPQLAWKIEAIESLMRRAEMVGKQSVPYHPGRSHNFMHNKMLIIDDTVVVGSYNLSHAAQSNAENMVAIESPALAERAIEYVHELRNSFLTDPTGGHKRDDAMPQRAANH